MEIRQMTRRLIRRKKASKMINIKINKMTKGSMISMHLKWHNSNHRKP